MPVHSFWFNIRLVRADCRLFSSTSALLVLGPIIFAVTSGYSLSEKVPLLWEQCLLADREVEVNRLNTDCLLRCELQRHSESIAMMSHHSNRMERLD